MYTFMVGRLNRFVRNNFFGDGLDLTRCLFSVERCFGLQHVFPRVGYALQYAIATGGGGHKHACQGVCGVGWMMWCLSCLAGATDWQAEKRRSTAYVRKNSETSARSVWVGNNLLRYVGHAHPGGDVVLRRNLPAKVKSQLLGGPVLSFSSSDRDTHTAEIARETKEDTQYRNKIP